jgi:hypothetical protein
VLKLRAVIAAGLLVLALGYGAVHHLQAETPQTKAPAKKAPPKPAPMHVIADADSAKFVPVPVPVGLPTTIEMSPIAGDPSKPGPFSLLLKIPANQLIAPHWHPAEEKVVPLRGTIQFGDGDKVDDSKMQDMNPGSVVHIPGHMHHYARAKGPATILVYGMGPFVITYVNPKDDPRPPAAAAPKK